MKICFIRVPSNSAFDALYWLFDDGTQMTRMQSPPIGIPTKFGKIDFCKRNNFKNSVNLRLKICFIRVPSYSAFDALCWSFDDGWHADDTDAKPNLEQLARDLEKVNKSAANSVREGLEELITLQKLGLNEKFKRSFGTTNPLESVNSQIAKYIGRVKRWQDWDMIFRWMATALLEIEPNMRKVANAKEFPLLRTKLKAALFSTNF